MFTFNRILIAIFATGMLAACDSPVSSMSDSPTHAPRSAAVITSIDPATGRSEAETTSLFGASSSSSAAEVLRSPIVFSLIYLPCLGDMIRLDGEVQYVRRTGESADGAFHEIDRWTRILNGVGLFTGDRYEIRDLVGYRQENSRLPFGSTSTSQTNFRIIKPGSGLVFTLQAVEHVTVDANGEIRVELHEVRSNCAP